MVNVTSQRHRRAVKHALLLVVLLHDPLSLRHLHTRRCPRGAGVRQRWSMQWTMPQQ